MKNKIQVLILTIIIVITALLGLVSCSTPETSDPVLNTELQDAHIVFLEYTVRYSSGTGNTEYIVVGYTLPNNNVLHTMKIHIDHVVFVDENIAELRHIKNEDDSISNNDYLYINEAIFIELLK